MSAPAPTVLIGFGMIGAGLADDRKMATYFDYASHAQVLRDHPGFEWQAVVDPAPAAQAAARDWGVPVVAADIHELPANLHPKVAVLACGPGPRAAILAALSGIKLAIVEKPVGIDGATAAQLMADCAARKIAVQVNLFRRADATTRALAAGGLVDRIGDVQAIFGVYGNGVHNNAVHMIDLIRLLAGEVVAVQALGPVSPQANAPIANDGNVAFALTLDNGVIAALQPVDFTHYREVGLDIWGTAGRLEVMQEGLVMRAAPRAKHRALDNAFEVATDAAQPLENTYGRALYAMYENAAAHLCHGETLVSPGESALINELIVDAIAASAATDGARIRLGG